MVIEDSGTSTKVSGLALRNSGKAYMDLVKGIQVSHSTSRELGLATMDMGQVIEELSLATMDLG